MSSLYTEEITYDKIFILFILGSLAGVVIEGIFCLFTKGRWESHVVSVIGPFNILYGAGAVLLYVGAVILKSRHIAVRILVLTLAATVLELLGGLLLRNVFGMRAWNYTGRLLNYKGLICFEFSLVWGAGAFLFSVLYPRINILLSSFHGGGWHTFTVLAGVILAVDLCMTSASIFRWSERHYGVEAQDQYDRYVDENAPDDWMKSRFMEWEFLDEV